MVFPSVPVYLDPHPPNWQQQQQGAGCSASTSTVSHQLPPMVPPPPPPIGGGGTGSIRPGSMSERARLAKIPQPEASLKCPRCESTNTKFCYFNNYSLTQPRHFCKTCRRYWTRGGALRNVPVGGGCRRNKRSKRSRSKSPIMSEHPSTSTPTTSAVSSNSCATELLGHLPPPSQLPFFAPLDNLPDFGNADIGLNFCGIHPPMATRGGGNEIHEFQIGNTSAAGAGPLNLSARFADQWKLNQVQQFPFLSSLEQPSGAYQFEGEVIQEPLGYAGGTSDQLGSKTALEVEALQLDSVKLENNHQGPNLSRNFSSVSGNDHYWTGNTWTDLSGSTSTAGHLM